MDLIRKIIMDLCKFSPRQGENEVRTAQYLENFLTQRKINFTSQYFKTEIPNVIHAELYLDGQRIPCLGKSFVGGMITSKDQIDFSPYSDYIETITFRPIPTVAISRTNAKFLEKANHVRGEVVVEKYLFQSRNILVGDTINPKKIIFAHYDGLGGGAVDNAGSVAICLELLIENPELLSENLFVFAGNEELSYDSGDYWGKGYREFENEYLTLLKSALEIVVVDGVGVSPPVIVSEDREDVFPINHFDEFSSKITWLSSIQSEVLKCYHCLEDTLDKLNFGHFEETRKMLEKMLG
ncbi:TPA: hypothetical protein DCZ81_02080 [Candidatus Collierbacteria bacterium]|nr:hypothetical protein [Candidatus Collierbacteria bacterium]HCX25842.1 hypothetical protein [Candidatus Collierbacteria bacterium]